MEKVKLYTCLALTDYLILQFFEKVLESPKMFSHFVIFHNHKFYIKLLWLYVESLAGVFLHLLHKEVGTFLLIR